MWSAAAAAAFEWLYAWNKLPPPFPPPQVSIHLFFFFKLILPADLHKCYFQSMHRCPDWKRIPASHILEVQEKVLLAYLTLRRPLRIILKTFQCRTFVLVSHCSIHDTRSCVSASENVRHAHKKQTNKKKKTVLFVTHGRPGLCVDQQIKAFSKMKRSIYRWDKEVLAPRQSDVNINRRGLPLLLSKRQPYPL